MRKLTFNAVMACLRTLLVAHVAQRSMQYTRGGQHVDRRLYSELTTYLERTFFNQ